MAELLTYVELDIVFCENTYGVAPCTASLSSSPPTGDIKCFNCISTCQDRPNFSEGEVTLRFAKATDYLPTSIDCIPNILSVSYSPSIVSLGANLGQRASLTVTFRDHPHSDTGEGYDKYLSERPYDPWEQGTYWGKFRARQPFLQGRPLRWITGRVGEDIEDMEIRSFIIESFSGPTPDGNFIITAKDILKLADGDRSQAPLLSSGFLSADINAAVTAATLLPTGIGNAEYPASGYLSIGGNEVVSFTRSGDNLTITRGQLGSTATTHKASDRVQVVLRYAGEDVADILYDLLVTYAEVPASYITLSDWQLETSAFLGSVYTANICEPTPVSTLAAELIEQAALSIWWDDIERKIRLRVLRAVVTDADTFTPENTMKGSLQLKEQPEKRISRVQVYFGQKDPTKPLSNLDNYRSTSLTIDDEAEEDYGALAIKTIVSRWIPEGGLTVADRLGAIQLGRFRDPPRHVKFDLMRFAETDAQLGIGYRVQSDCVQDATGAQDDIPIQVTRLNPGADKFTVEAEEMLWTAPAADTGVRTIIYDASNQNRNLKTTHDSLYFPAESGDVVNCIINSGVVISSANIDLPAFDVGIWPAGVIVTLIVNGRIAGAGGDGGNGGLGSGIGVNGGNGNPGGVALYCRSPINLEFPSGAEIWGGAGGGGGGGGGSTNHLIPAGGGGGGGGGGGRNAGAGGIGGNGVIPGFSGSGGTDFSGGGAGGGGNYPSTPGAPGGGAGGPGTAGSPGGSRAPFGGGTGGSGGAAGAAIDGISYVTVTVSGGSQLGASIN